MYINPHLPQLESHWSYFLMFKSPHFDLPSEMFMVQDLLGQGLPVLRIKYHQIEITRLLKYPIIYQQDGQKMMPN